MNMLERIAALRNVVREAEERAGEPPQLDISSLAGADMAPVDTVDRLIHNIKRLREMEIAQDQHVDALKVALADEELVLQARRAMKEDWTVLQQIGQDAKAIYALPDQMNDALRLFKVIFKKSLSSQTVVVAQGGKGNNGTRSDPAITATKHGFGIRKNMQSREVQDWDDVLTIMAKKDEIIQSLKRHRCDAAATKFNQFCMVAPLNKTPEGLSWGEVWRLQFTTEQLGCGPILALGYRASSVAEINTITVALVKKHMYNPGDSSASESRALAIKIDRTDVLANSEGTDAIQYFMLRSHFPAIARQINEMRQDMERRSQEWTSKIQEHFAMELLLDSV